MTPVDSSLLIIKNTDAVVTFNKSHLTVEVKEAMRAGVSMHFHVFRVHAERGKLTA